MSWWDSIANGVSNAAIISTNTVPLTNVTVTSVTPVVNVVPIAPVKPVVAPVVAPLPPVPVPVEKPVVAPVVPTPAPVVDVEPVVVPDFEPTVVKPVKPKKPEVIDNSGINIEYDRTDDATPESAKEYIDGVVANVNESVDGLVSDIDAGIAIVGSILAGEVTYKPDPNEVSPENSSEEKDDVSKYVDPTKNG